MSYITDRDHLLKVAEDGIAAVEALAHAWIAEDQAACAPRSRGFDGPTTGGGTSDTTLAIATGRDVDDHAAVPRVDTTKYTDRDRLGSQLLAMVGRLKEMAGDLEPRKAGGDCACCGERGTATHGRDHRGRPTDCWSCWQFLRRMGYRCDVEVHEGRPEPLRFCACPVDCCEDCHDRAAEGRRVSERCKKRMQRAAS